MIDKVYIFVLLFIFTSCNKDIFMEAKKLYQENKQNFSEIISLMDSKKEVYSLNRYESSFPDNTFSNKAYWLNYTLRVSMIRKGFIIFIDSNYKGKESSFWEKELYEIKTNGNHNLQEILDSNHITKQTFMKLKDFLSKNKFYMITRVIDSDYIIIMINQTSGFLYSPEQEMPKYVEADEIRKIDDHIYYFKLKP